MSKTLVFMPAFNEVNSIASVISGIQSLGLDLDILVVDDGSSDNTGGIARALDADTVTLPINLGIGAAVETGYKYATNLGYDYVIRIDADGQHDPKYIPQILEQLQHYDIVLTTRFTDKNDYPIGLIRKWSIIFLSHMLSWAAPIKITDATNSYRGTNARAAKFLAENSQAEFMTDAIDVLAYALKAGYSVVQIPIDMRVRQSGEPSQNLLKLIYHMLRTLISLVVIMTTRKGEI
ncbi:MAG: glycosyltransferase family 2 protein [Bifidobacteriaceae bacterium]|jgi:glycosyltransferase involved in cell wall biosynthesis|nr:glycosyltransferase family 2 protein [Bifidobacteriaceae bacterium]